MHRYVRFYTHIFYNICYTVQSRNFKKANYYKTEFAICLQDRLRTMRHSRSFIWWEDERQDNVYVVWNATTGEICEDRYDPNSNTVSIITDFMWEAWQQGGNDWKLQWEYIMDNDTELSPSPFILPSMQHIFASYLSYLNIC